MENKNTEKWPSRLFITGIDTDAGKSYATGWLANLVSADGGRPMTMKFVQTGNDDFSEDILKTGATATVRYVVELLGK